MLKRLLIALAVWLIAGPAPAQMAGVLGGPFTVSASYTGPGDIVPFTAWYGLRAYSAAIVTTGTQKLVNLRNTSTNETCDVIVSASGGLGVTANCSITSNGLSVGTFCTAGCAVAELYDQVSTKHLLQATAGSQPTLLANCVGSFYCLQAAGATSMTAGSNITPASGTVSMEMVANRYTGTSNWSFGENGTGTTSNRLIGTNTTANSMTLGGGSSGSFTFTASDATNHAVNAVIAGASAVANVDGVETTGTATGNTTAGSPHISAGSVQTPEMGLADNVTLSGTQRTNLCRNQQAYYGAGNFGATC